MKRYYICPVVPHPTRQGAQKPKVALYPTTRLSVQHSPSKTWCLAVVEAQDFSAIDADTECQNLLEKIEDAANATTRAELVAWLKAHTVGDVPANLRTKINNRLQSLGLDTSQITLQTTLFQVVRGVLRALNPVGNLEDLG